MSDKYERRIARFMLRTFGRFLRFGHIARSVALVEMFLAALGGRGGGSGWDHAGQISALLRHVKFRTGMIIFDVGANNGKWSAEVSARLKDCLPRFFLFECAPCCYDELLRNANFIINPIIIRKAVSDTTGEISFNATHVGSGLSSVYKREDTSVQMYEYAQITVDCINIDTFMREHGIERIDVLKIDVEGHELAVLRGAKDAFDRKRIDVVLFEFSSASINSRTFFIDYWQFFNEIGFEIYRIVPGGYALRILNYDDTLEYFRGSSNYIACQSDP